MVDLWCAGSVTESVCILLIYSAGVQVWLAWPQVLLQAVVVCCLLSEKSVVLKIAPRTQWGWRDGPLCCGTGLWELSDL